MQRGWLSVENTNGSLLEASLIKAPLHSLHWSAPFLALPPSWRFALSCGAVHSTDTIRLRGGGAGSDRRLASAMAGLPRAVSDALRVVEGVSPDLREVSMVLNVDEARAPVCSAGERAPLTVWLKKVAELLRRLAPHERAQWDGVLGTLETLSPVWGAI